MQLSYSRPRLRPRLQPPPTGGMARLPPQPRSAHLHKRTDTNVYTSLTLFARQPTIRLASGSAEHFVMTAAARRIRSGLPRTGPEWFQIKGWPGGPSKTGSVHKLLEWRTATTFSLLDPELNALPMLPMGGPSAAAARPPAVTANCPRHVLFLLVDCPSARAEGGQKELSIFPFGCRAIARIHVVLEKTYAKKTQRRKRSQG